MADNPSVRNVSPVLAPFLAEDINIDDIDFDFLLAPFPVCGQLSLLRTNRLWRNWTLAKGRPGDLGRHMLESKASPTPSARLWALRDCLEVFVRRGIAPPEALLSELDA